MKQDSSQAELTRKHNTLREKIYAFQQSRVILSAFELDIFSHIENKHNTCKAIAKKTRSNTAGVERLLNALVAIGFLTKRVNRFYNTETSSIFLVKGNPDYLPGMMHAVNQWKTWSTLTDAVICGHTVIDNPFLKRSKKWFEAFIGAMHDRAKRQAPAVVSQINLDGVKKVLDVGGGSGAFAMAFVRGKKNITATVFDLPAVIPITRKYIRSEKLSGKVKTISGDYTIDDFGSGYDLIFLCAVVHSNSSETNKKLISKCAKALNKGGRIIIQDYIMDNNRVNPASGAMFSINMLVGTEEGDTYTKRETYSWMKEAGLRNMHTIPTSFGTDLVIGIKP